MPRKYKTTSLYNIRIGNDKLSRIKRLAIKNDMTLNQFFDHIINSVFRVAEKYGSIQIQTNKDQIVQKYEDE